MELLKIIFLSVIQGIAEFLPISSSGHLAVLGTLFGFDPEENLALGIVLHAGTLLAILIFYLKTLLKFFRKDHFHLALMIVLGSVPAGIFGVTLKMTGIAVACALCSSTPKNFSISGTSTEPPPAPKSPFRMPVPNPIEISLKCFLNKKNPSKPQR